MDKRVSRRDEILEVVSGQLRLAVEHMSALEKELADVNANRSDLLAALEVLQLQADGLRMILDRPTEPQAVGTIEFDGRMPLGWANEQARLKQGGGKR